MIISLFDRLCAVTLHIHMHETLYTYFLNCKLTSQLTVVMLPSDGFVGPKITIMEHWIGLFPFFCALMHLYKIKVSIY